MGILILKNGGGTTLADDDGICAGQSIAAGGGALTLNGSLIAGGLWENSGAGYKVKVVSAGDDSGATFTVVGRFYASNSVGGYSETITITGPNASSATSALYATKITGVSVNTATASSVTVGLAADSAAVPTTLSDGSLYQFDFCGTFGGATVGLKKYNPTANEWLSIGTTTAAAAVVNYEIPAGTTIKADITSGSATSAIIVEAFGIRKDR